MTGRWLRVRSVHLIKVKSSGRDWKLRGERPDIWFQHLVDSSKVPERENRDWTRPVNLTGASGHPIEAHNGSFLTRCINTSSIHVRGYFCSFQQLRNTLESAKESKNLVR